MALKMMYITNKPEVARIAEKYSVDRIWVDLERNGKSDRQAGLNTVQSTHTLQDVSVIRDSINEAQLLVRVNPINNDSKKEIDEVIARGADVIMLPYFATVDEAKRFIDYVDGRARCNLLVETIGAENNIDKILKLDGIDEMHIGLNDLHLQYGYRFMFQLLSNGKVESLCEKIKMHGIPYGFGGIARLDEGLLPARHILGEHYRLGSSMVILSRSFYDSWLSNDLEEIERVFRYGMQEIREYEQRLEREDEKFFEDNRNKVIKEVNDVVSLLGSRK